MKSKSFLLLNLLCFYSHGITLKEIKDESKDKGTISESLIAGIRKQKQNSLLSDEDVMNRALMLMMIGRVIKGDPIFDEIEHMYNTLKKENDEYYNHQLLIKLVKNNLFSKEYENPQSEASELQIHNMSAKLNFTFTITKITTKNQEEVNKLKECIIMQQNVDFDVDKHSQFMRDFLHNRSTSVMDIPYRDLYFVPQYLGHVKIPSEYNEVQSFLKNYGYYFIYGRESTDLSGIHHTYYVLCGVKQGKPLSLKAFKQKKEAELFQKFILQLLKQTDFTIENQPVMNVLDRDIAKILFPEIS